MIGQLARLLVALNSESSPRQLSLGLTLGMVIGLTPTLSLHNLLVLLLVLVLRVNLSAFLLSWAVFTPFYWLFGGLMAQFGDGLLQSQALQGLWTALYQFEWFRLAHLHHTLTLGSLVAALIKFVPLYFIAHWLIVRYRVHVQAYIEKFKIVKALKSSRLFQLYQSYSQ